MIFRDVRLFFSCDRIGTAVSIGRHKLRDSGVDDDACLHTRPELLLPVLVEACGGPGARVGKEV